MIDNKKHNIPIPPPPPLPPPKTKTNNRVPRRNSTRTHGVATTTKNPKSNLMIELQKKTRKRLNNSNAHASTGQGGTTKSGVQVMSRNNAKKTMNYSKVVDELKARFDTGAKSKNNRLKYVGKLLRGNNTKLQLYMKGNHVPSNENIILHDRYGLPYRIFIPATMREANKNILSNNKLRPTRLKMTFTDGYFGKGYYNNNIFGIVHENNKKSLKGTKQNLPKTNTILNTNTIKCIQLNAQLEQINNTLKLLKC